ncbi:UNVERIFIED_CONTAM: hypothetical protein FKN15_007219 [Acipenser sinensis]
MCAGTVGYRATWKPAAPSHPGLAALTLRQQQKTTGQPWGMGAGPQFTAYSCNKPRHSDGLVRRGGHVHMPCTVGEVPCRALVDTGAPSRSFSQDCCHNVEKLVKPRGPRLSQINQSDPFPVTHWLPMFLESSED